MKTFKVIVAYFTFNEHIHGGTLLELNLSQYEARKHALEVVKPATKEAPGLFKVTATTGFKCGEVFGAEMTPDPRRAPCRPFWLETSESDMLEDITGKSNPDARAEASTVKSKS